MNLRKFNIEDLFNRDYVEGFFEELSGLSKGISCTVGSYNIEEKEDSFIYQVLAPGLKKSDIELNVKKNVLEVRNKLYHEGKELPVLNKLYNLKVYVPKNVDLDNISADLKDGILYVTFQKMQKDVNKEIPIG